MNVIFSEINTGPVVYVLICSREPNKCTQTGVPSVGVSSFGAECYSQSQSNGTQRGIFFVLSEDMLLSVVMN